jgi:uncharacterized protein (DUF885 family)
MDRRRFLATTGAAAGIALLPKVAFGTEASGDAALNATFEEIFQRSVARSPEQATSLGLDKGANAPLKHRLTPRTYEERARQQAEIKEALAGSALSTARACRPTRSSTSKW